MKTEDSLSCPQNPPLVVPVEKRVIKKVNRSSLFHPQVAVAAAVVVAAVRVAKRVWASS